MNRHIRNSRAHCARIFTGTLLFLGSLGAAIAQDAPKASFEASQTANASGGATDEQTLMSFNFRFAPWEEVLRMFADAADLTLDLDVVPSGTFSYYDAGTYTPLQALDVLNGYLLQRGYVLIRRDRFLVCMNTEKGIPPNLIPQVTADQLSDHGKNSMLRAIFPFGDGNASQAATEIQQLLGPQSSVAVLRAANSLVITDIGSNLRLVKQLIDAGAFDGAVETSAGNAFQSFELEHIRAEEAERTLRRLFGLATDQGADPGQHGPGDLSITTDSRTNRLLVKGPADVVNSIQEMIKAVDVESEEGASNSRSVVRILPLGNSDVLKIGQALRALTPRIQVSTTHSTVAREAGTSEPTARSPDSVRSDSQPEGDAAAQGRGKP